MADSLQSSRRVPHLCSICQRALVRISAFPPPSQAQRSKAIHTQSLASHLNINGGTFFIEVTQPEINDFDISIVVYENVLGFNVPMSDPEPVQILKPLNDLVEYLAGLVLRKPA